MQGEWLRYSIRRYFRIAPMFYIAMFANGVYLYFNNNNFSLQDYIIGVFFLHGFFPDLINTIVIGGWSVADEFIFYLIFPILCLFIKSFRASIVLFVSSLIFCILISSFLASRNPIYTEFFTNMWFVYEFPVFCIGIVVYYLVKKISSYTDGNVIKFFTSIIFTFSFVSFILIPTDNSTIYLSSMMLGGCVAGIYFCNFKFFVSKYIQFVGKISYSIYLLHFFIIIFLSYCIKTYGVSVPNQGIYAYFSVFVIFVLISAMSLPLSSLSYYCVERPFVRIGLSIINIVIPHWLRLSRTSE